MRHPDDPHRTILVAEDSIETLTLYSIVVERMGYTSLKARSLDEAYQYLDETADLDLILLGTYLDGQMYTDTVYKLRQHPAAAHLPILVASHRTNPETLIAAFEMGVTDVLPSPVMIPELMNVIQRYIG
ncbi:MAG: response regulator [Anaerolineaceae bacterium]|nr:response regulator [Anaerolineaceae bacterium]